MIQLTSLHAKISLTRPKRNISLDNVVYGWYSIEYADSRDNEGITIDAIAVLFEVPQCSGQRVSEKFPGDVGGYSRVYVGS